jgi:hypothetical protein
MHGETVKFTDFTDLVMYRNLYPMCYGGNLMLVTNGKTTFCNFTTTKKKYASFSYNNATMQ